MIKRIPDFISDILDFHGSSFFKNDQKTTINPIIIACECCGKVILQIPIKASDKFLRKKIQKHGFYYHSIL